MIIFKLYTITVTRILYFRVSYNVLQSVIQAYQPDGNLGCFADVYGESLVNSVIIYKNSSNKGDVCIAECKYRTKRYAGTKERRCFCGSDVVQNRKRNSTECNQPCPGNSSETCGGFYNYLYNRISLYDTWICIKDPCQNGATCTDIDAESYNCSCSVGWIGPVCNETVTSTTYPEIQSPSTQAIGSSTVAETDITTTYTIFPSSNTQSIVHVAAQPSENKMAIYIAVPVSIVVLIVIVLIVTVLILRKKLDQNEDGLQAIYQTSSNAATGGNDHNYDAIDQTASDRGHNYYNTSHTVGGDHNYTFIDRTENGDHSYYSIDRTAEGELNYININ